MFDGYNRNIDYVRLSVTDRCNLRCIYCMPPEGISCMPMKEILTYEELEHLCHILVQTGIRKLKITGGEPFVRKGICDLIETLKKMPGIEEVTLTTNGLAIMPWLKRLKDMDIDGINFSLDTLDPAVFYRISGSCESGRTMAAVCEALRLGIHNIKINCVPIQSMNDSEIATIAAIARDYPVHVRFIELMPIGYGKRFHAVPEAVIREQLETIYGSLVPIEGPFGNGPAHYYHINGFQGHIGFISAMSHRFCASCNRIRLTSDGHLKTCLFFDKGIDLKASLRNGLSDEVIVAQIRQALLEKPKHHDLDNEIPETKGMSQIGG